MMSLNKVIGPYFINQHIVAGASYEHLLNSFLPNAKLFSFRQPLPAELGTTTLQVESGPVSG